MSDTWQPSLPGLSLDALGEGPSSRPQSGIAGAALATVRALDEAQQLRPQDALTVQLVVELAGAIGRGLSWGKVSVATAQLTKQLLDAMEKLPQPATADDALGAAWREFQELVLNGAEA